MTKAGRERRRKRRMAMRFCKGVMELPSVEKLVMDRLIESLITGNPFRPVTDAEARQALGVK